MGIGRWLGLPGGRQEYDQLPVPDYRAFSRPGCAWQDSPLYPYWNWSNYNGGVDEVARTKKTRRMNTRVQHGWRLKRRKITACIEAGISFYVGRQPPQVTYCHFTSHPGGPNSKDAGHVLYCSEDWFSAQLPHYILLQYYCCHGWSTFTTIWSLKWSIDKWLT